MRNVLRLLGLFALLAVLPSARAADVTGTWKGARTKRTEPQVLRLRLAQRASQFSLKMTVGLGKGQGRRGDVVEGVQVARFDGHSSGSAVYLVH